MIVHQQQEQRHAAPEVVQFTARIGVQWDLAAAASCIVDRGGPADLAECLLDVAESLEAKP